MAAKNPKIAICILFFEKPDQTIDCVKSFLPSKQPIYILNNNSSKCSTQTLQKFIKEHPQVKLFRSHTNLGVSGGRNYLIRHTTEKWLFFVDNDITITTPDWLKIAQNTIKKHPQTDAVIPKLYNQHEGLFVIHLRTKIKNNTAIFLEAKNNTQPNIFPGGASIINRHVFKKHGLYDEDMFVGLEDFELAIRAIKNDSPFKAIIADKIQLVHNHIPVKTTQDKKAVLVRYNIQKIQHSHNVIKKKHGLHLDNDWRPWVTNQIRIMTNHQSFIQKLINLFKKNGH